MRCVALVAFVLAACSAKETTAPKQQPPGEAKASGFVLVPRDVWLRSAPESSVDGAHFTQPPERCARPTAWVMRLVGRSGDWLAVENLQAAEATAHCYGHLPALEGWRIRMFLARSDVIPVTRREVDVAFDDGTGFTLAAGVSAVASADEYRVQVDDNDLVLPVPRDAVATTYPAPTPHLLPDTYRFDDDDRVLPGATTLLHGKPIHVRANAIEQHGTIVRTTSKCSSFRVAVPSHDGGTGRGSIGCGKPGELGVAGPRVAAGARVTWPDGRPAGEALTERVIRWPVGARDDRQCFRLPVVASVDWPDPTHPSDEWFLTLCVPKSQWIERY